MEAVLLENVIKTSEYRPITRTKTNAMAILRIALVFIIEKIRMKVAKTAIYTFIQSK